MRTLTNWPTCALVLALAGSALAGACSGGELDGASASGGSGALGDSVGGSSTGTGGLPALGGSAPVGGSAALGGMVGGNPIAGGGAPSTGGSSASGAAGPTGGAIEGSMGGMWLVSGGTGSEAGGAAPASGGADTGAGGAASGGGGGTGGAGAGSSGWSVDEGGFVTLCDYSGYAWTTVDDSSTLSPEDFSELPQGGPLCASGTLVADDAWGSYGIVGVNLGQPAGAEESADVPISGTGVTIDVSNPAGSPLRVAVQDAAGTQWCMDIEAGVTTVPWADLRMECWGTSGQAYGGEPINAIIVQVPGHNVNETPFEFCIDALALEGAECSGSGIGTGGAAGVGGAAGAGGSDVGGGSSVGGSEELGGAPNSGGTEETGGSPSTGGSPAMGGFPGTGGLQQAGGAQAAGGTMELDCPTLPNDSRHNGMDSSTSCASCHRNACTCFDC